MKKRLLICVVIAAVMLLTSACSRNEAQGTTGQKRPALKFPVEVQEVEIADVQYTVEAVGSVEAFEQVAVTARVAGVVDRVRFREGAKINAGTHLIEIDPERYRLAVASAEATLAQEEAALAEARTGLARRASASERNPGLIRGEEIDTWRTRVATAEGEVLQAKVALQQANLNLRDAFVTAPVAGTIQTRTVQTGQYVQPGSVLATLVRRDPLLLRFQVPEREAEPLRPNMRASFRVAESTAEYTAKVTHVAASASAESRLVAVTAEVDDPKRDELRPGAFARVTVPISEKLPSPVVPQTAIRPSERGFLAFVVENGRARERILTLGLRTLEGKAEVREGLKAGDLVVIRGNEALRDGVEVEVK